ncbi:MAG: hypothetical protein M1830_007332 [Pleopsidium flavum]|nr:MAG: hypothetical protein M1830_007332 [Pleopsidium flavum]
MCQYTAQKSAYVTVAVCADVQRTGNPFDCRRQTFVYTEASPRAFSSNYDQETLALGRHLEIITSEIDRSATTDSSDGVASSVRPRKLGRKAIGKAKSIGAAAIRRIKGHFDLKERLRNRREARANSLSRLSQANDSTDFVHRRFERSRIENMATEVANYKVEATDGGLKSYKSYSVGEDEDKFEEVMEQIKFWVVTGMYWAKGTYREGPRVRFLHDEEHEVALGGCQVEWGYYTDF